MKVPRSPAHREVRSVWSRAGLACLLAVLAVIPLISTSLGARAQEATPIAAGSIVTPTPGCGERLGIGDASVSCLTFVHASGDAGSVDISLDGSTLFTGVSFASSTGFVAVPAGTYHISVAATGQPETVLLDDPNLEVTEGVGVEIAIVGSRDGSTLRSLTLPIDPTTPSAGSASLRIVQAIPDAPPLDIGLAGGETLIDSLVPLAASGYLSIPATTASIEVRTAGTSDVLFPIPNFTVAGGATLTVYALGTVTNPTGITLLTVIVPGDEGVSSGTPAATGTPVATPAA